MYLLSQTSPPLLGSRFPLKLTTLSPALIHSTLANQLLDLQSKPQLASSFMRS